MKYLNKNIDLSVIIPVYNVGKTIFDALDRIFNILNSINLNYEIIIVNDGSIDDTLNILEEIKSTKSNLQIFSYEENKGKGLDSELINQFIDIINGR